MRKYAVQMIATNGELWERIIPAADYELAAQKFLRQIDIARFLVNNEDVAVSLRVTLCPNI